MKLLLFVFIFVFVNKQMLCSANANRMADVIVSSVLTQMRSTARNIFGYNVGNQLADGVKSFIFPPKVSTNQRGESPYQPDQGGPRNANPRVQTNDGLVIGDTTADSHAFYGIPYAAPPIGNKRFMPPEPVANFDEMDVSVPDRRNCFQTLPCDPNCDAELDGYVTEDCLVLQMFVPLFVNLSDPNNPPKDRLPVMLWLHGGFFLLGAGTSYERDGHKLSAAANAIIVSINYRLGPLGFLSFQDSDTFIEGNQGFKDQQLALEWVHNNIEKFGGDKNRVTLFGNSAGSQTIMFHFLSSKSDPYFQRGVIQSSPTVFPYQTALDSNKTTTKRYLDALECNDDPSCLRNLDASILIEGTSKMLASSLADNDLFGAIEPFRPTIDGEEFQAQPLTLFKKGLWQSHKELIIGTTHEEMAWVEAVFGLIPFPFPKALFELINKRILGEENGQIMIDYYDDERLDFDYANNFAREVTDLFFACPNRALARFASETTTNNNNSVYLYNYAYPISMHMCSIMEDVADVCGTAYHSSERVILFKSDFAFNTNFTEEDQFVSDTTTAYWGEFAHIGNLNEEWDYAQFPAWPVYKKNENNSWPNININYPQTTIELDYKKEICDLWDQTGFYFEAEENATIATTSEQTTTTTTVGYPSSTNSEDSETTAWTVASPTSSVPGATTTSTASTSTTTKLVTTTQPVGETESTTNAAAIANWRLAIIIQLIIAVKLCTTN